MPRSVFSDAYLQSIALLVSLRKERGLSQEEVASRLGKKQSFVSLVELCQRRIDIVELYAFIKAMGADPEEVFQRLARQMPDKVDI